MSRHALRTRCVRTGNKAGNELRVQSGVLRPHPPRWGHEEEGAQREGARIPQERTSHRTPQRNAHVSQHRIINMVQRPSSKPAAPGSCVDKSNSIWKSANEFQKRSTRSSVCGSVLEFELSRVKIYALVANPGLLKIASGARREEQDLKNGSKFRARFWKT